MEPTRREVVQLLTALGLSGTAATVLAAQARPDITASDLKAALAIHGIDLPRDEIEVISRALARSLERFQAVRDLEIDDGVRPAVLFVPGRS